jgi:myo-inositol-1(or 4)-monophosphatase
MAAGALLIQEAGGLVGDLEGDAGFMESGDICAATPKVFPALLDGVAVKP